MREPNRGKSLFLSSLKQFVESDVKYPEELNIPGIKEECSLTAIRENVIRKSPL